MGNTKTYIGIDLSMTRTGVGMFIEEKGKVESALCFSIKTDPSWSVYKRAEYAFSELMSHLGYDGSFAFWKDKVFCIEGYSMGSTSGKVFTMGEFGGIVRLSFLRYGAELYELPPTSLKKFSTGKGNAKKPQMIAKAVELFGSHIKKMNHDEADALLLAAALHHYTTRNDVFFSPNKEEIKALSSMTRISL